MRIIETSDSHVIRNLIFSFSSLMLVWLIGTLGYRLLGGEQYTWLDCFYMTFITIATIGYGEVVDVTHYEYGRLFTIFIGVTGIGVLGYVLSTVTAFMLESDLNETWRKNKMLNKIKKLNNHYLVCGIGLIGNNVAHELSSTGRNCVIIDSNMDQIQRYLDSHPNQLYLHGDATDNDILLAAGVARAHGVFAVAHDDSQNLVISLSAKQLNPELRVVARCHDLKNAEKTRRAGADEIVSPDFTGGLRIVSAMVRPQVVSFLDDMLRSDSNMRMEEVKIPDTLAGQPLRVLYHGNHDCLVLAVRNSKHDWVFNPPALYPIEKNDVLMVMTTPSGRARLEHLMQGAGS
jgi:voltage-gated potassium channel